MTSGVYQLIIALAIALSCIGCSASFVIPFRIIEEKSEALAPFASFIQSEVPLAISNNLFVIDVEIGTPPQRAVLKLSSRASGIWIHDHANSNLGFDMRISSTFSILNREATHSFGEGIIAQDKIGFQGFDLQVDHFPFFLIQKPTSLLEKSSDYVGELAIGLEDNPFNQSTTRYSFNLLLYFHETKDISKQLLVLSIDDSKKGQLTIGKYPKELQELKKLRECPAKSREGSGGNWSCWLDSIYFSDNKLFPVRQLVDISIGGNAIMTSQAFFNDLISNYFQTDIDSKICRNASYGPYLGVTCETAYDENKIGVISFVFGKWGLKLVGSELFKLEESGSKRLRIITLKGNTAWFLSPSVLLKHYVVFDKDAKRVGFYPKK